MLLPLTFVSGRIEIFFHGILDESSYLRLEAHITRMKNIGKIGSPKCTYVANRCLLELAFQLLKPVSNDDFCEIRHQIPRNLANSLF